MPDQPSTRGGSFARAAYVMAVVKRDELSRYLMEKQPFIAIARHFDRNITLINRAVDLLKRHEARIANGDLTPVAREVWRDRLGWERCQTYLEARSFIERGELMPKFNTGTRRKRVRRKSDREAETTGNNAAPQPTPSIAPSVPIVVEAPKLPPTPVPSPPPKKPQIPDDDLLSEMAGESPLLRQVARAATTRITP